MEYSCNQNFRGCLVGPLNWKPAKPTIIPMFHSYRPESINFNRFGQLQNPILILQRYFYILLKSHPEVYIRLNDFCFEYDKHIQVDFLKKRREICSNKSGIIGTLAHLYTLFKWHLYSRCGRTTENWNRSSRFGSLTISWCRTVSIRGRREIQFPSFCARTPKICIWDTSLILWNARADLHLQRKSL